MKLFTFRKMQIKSTMRYFYILINMDKIKTNKNNWHYQVLLRIQCKNSSHSLLWKCKLVKPLWNMVDVNSAWDLPIPLLHIYSRQIKAYAHNNEQHMNVQSSFFIISKNEKLPKSIQREDKQNGCIYTMNYYSPM